MRTSEAFKSEVEGFLARTEMSPTAFGRLSVGDPNFIRNIRDGRMPSLRLVERVDDFMRSWKSGAAA